MRSARTNSLMMNGNERISFEWCCDGLPYSVIMKSGDAGVHGSESGMCARQKTNNCELCEMMVSSIRRAQTPLAARKPGLPKLSREASARSDVGPAYLSIRTAKMVPSQA